MKKIQFDGYLLIYLADNAEGRWKGSFAVLRGRTEISRGSLPLTARSEDDAELEILAAARHSSSVRLAA
ncbi:hypothetical protein J8I26_04640 [Herbaspirillum sp. LeCh32-8]|uniref:hypothetical protein n=1 Tax=Herbaspirillum sp. LeCh32-8 TaxID=2821356 RepID=UPI001AE2A7B0|nr:hypothetical protein [Herbaspirillum sp. LeCh32-8]MBP0597379.1 hypothetical protein [Herbaspirillum sp. LeCh32-8]